MRVDRGNGEQTHYFYSNWLVENNPDSDHFDKNGAITQRVTKRCQPGINLN